MVTEYYYWEGNYTVKKNSLPEIRKAFIKRNGKRYATNIFKRGYGVAGRIYYATGSWVYDDYTKGIKYIINENGYVTENLGKSRIY